MFTLGEGLINWRSILQSVITLFNTKAEYIIVTNATKETFWLKGLIIKLHQCAFQLHCDSKSAIHLSKN